MSAWITVAIAFQRMLVITRFRDFTTSLTPCRIRLLLTILCAVCTAITAYPMWTVGLRFSDQGSSCSIISATYDSWILVSYVVGSLLLPQALLIAFTSVIICHLVRSRRLQQQVCNLTYFPLTGYEIQMKDHKKRIDFTNYDKDHWTV